MNDQAYRGPDRRWSFGEWTITRYKRRYRPGGKLWGAQARGRGTDMFRTPIGAVLHLRRWFKREPILSVPAGGGSTE